MLHYTNTHTTAYESGAGYSGSSLFLISVELLKAIGDTKRIDPYNNRVLTANITSVKILGKVELLVQMKPKKPEFLHEFLVTQENHISFLLLLDILTDQKCILDLNEKILLCGRDKFSIPLITQNVNNVNSFTLLLETLIIQARHEAWIDVIAKNENAEVTKKSQGLVEGLKDLENRTGVLVADCLISVNDSKSQLRVFNLSDNDIKLFQNTKLGEFFSNDDSIQVNGLFTSKKKPKHPEVFRMGTHATLEGTDLSRNQSEKVVAMFMRHNQVLSRNSNDFGFCDKIKHKKTRKRCKTIQTGLRHYEL